MRRPSPPPADWSSSSTASSPWFLLVPEPEPLRPCYSSFLPFLLAICSILDQRAIHLPRYTQEKQGRSILSPYAVAALIWGLATADTLFLTERTTSVICPEGWTLERLTPLIQLITSVFDSVLIVRIGRLRQSGEDQAGTWHLLGTLFLISAAALAFLAVWPSIDPINYSWSFLLRWLAVVDLVADSIAVTIGVISSIFLLGVFHPTTVGLLIVSTSVFVSIQSKIAGGIMIEAWSTWWGILTGIVVFLGVGILLHLAKSFSSHSPHAVPSRESAFSKNRYIVYSVAAFLLVFCQTAFSHAGETWRTPERLIADAKKDSDMWITMAAKSTTLESAVVEYRQRYGIPPPPNFDKWYEFAVAAKSPIIDTFDQINSDLLPFWGETPAALRQRTAYLLDHPVLSMGGLIIEDGKVEISPHVPGTHAWMLLVVKEMVEPFAEWLPNMQLAFNLDDECRISVSFDQMKAYTEDAAESRARLGAKQELLPFSAVQDPPWMKDFLNADEKIWERSSPWFFQKSKSPIFYEWISPTCPAEAPVNHYRWWNRKANCQDCSSPHMRDGFVSNWALAGDPCHQPDLAYLHGFFTSPGALAPSRGLFPVFSQSRVHNFADILYPSPWNFGDKVTSEDENAIPWTQKLNSVFWRGASSDGFAVHGTWQMFMRARFVHLVTKARASFGAESLLRLIRPSKDGRDSPAASELLSPFPPRTPKLLRDQLIVNVSFVGDFTRCDGRDCAAQHTTFYGSAAAPPPPSIGFQDSWHHRHLVDFDGAAFSGRFLPFLASASLPYRAALFRTWWEERVHAWRHFVPLDVRLTDFWPAMGYFAGTGGGEREAREIADAGREWAKRALRKEDMQVYMFRLLLEWGRIVDDRREEMGFVLGE
ncbi:hypothetical protein F4809DRAFT_659831 [Biscogniauxia mediterranea]|nr:hypothetical protein F4809DRAFT_659831 [Biscogniauxia mediterranea]